MGASIAEVEVIPIVAPPIQGDDLDSSAETLVVRIVDDDGVEGIGEADASAEVVAAFLEMRTTHGWSQGVREVLIGADPFELRALAARLYDATIYAGRRGLGIHALSAVDVALHDLVGKQLGRPVYQLLGGARRDALRPYATIYPALAHGRSAREVLDALFALAARALEDGFRAVKLEYLLYDLISDRDLVDAIHEGRRVIGDDITLLIDLGYRWHDWRDALWTLRRVEDADVWLAEATLQHDDLDGHARLAERTEIRVGGAELAATRFECREWLERGRVDVLQPDINRCGGLSEAQRIAQIAELHGAQMVPHCWKTGITAAAARHFQAATPNCPYIEHLSPRLWASPLRASLVSPEPAVRPDGTLPLPDAPGLGVQLDREIVERYRVRDPAS